MKAKKDLKTELEEKKKDPASEETLFNLPEVKDIPGQEHIQPPPAGEMADTTISSDDEEGRRVFGNDETITSDSDVLPEEKQALRDAAERTPDSEDDNHLRDANLDDRDEDGELLNEKTNLSGSDLDIPGSEDDDDDEAIGAEDEENNHYSLDDEDDE